jgi:hypothetical protein
MGEFATVSIDKKNFLYLKLTQVAKNHFAFVTTLLWHYYSFEITLKKLYLYGKYSTQTMILWFLCALFG